MKARSSSPIVLMATLFLGVVLGVVADRSGRRIAAQATRPESSAATATATAPAHAATTTVLLARRPAEEEALYQQLARQYEQFQPINRTFELVARAVSPCVVHIVAKKTTRSEDGGRVKHFEETGSGVIVRAEHAKGLYVLTNNHVVENAASPKINIYLQDGRVLHPDRQWLDPKADIAVLGLGRDDLPAARPGNSDELAVGNWVLALGSPFGLTHSVSQGIISARGRHMDELQDMENQDFLQTDAAINPGNSGGPLVNMKGEVIGINNSIASNGGGNEGVGFSIPINLARWIMDELLTHGRVSRGALGIDLHPEFKPEDAVTLGLERPKGAWIDLVHSSSPASEAGMRDGDVILRFRGTEVLDLNHLINMVSMAPIGQSAEVVVWRGGKQMSLTVKVGSRDRTAAQSGPPVERATTKGLLKRPDRPSGGPSYALGLELTTLDAESAKRLRLPENLRGAAVTKVGPDSPVAASFKLLDVIATIDGKTVATAEEAVKALNTRIGKTPLALGIDRMGQGLVERRSVQLP